MLKQNANLETVPAILNNMLGKTYIFKLSLTSYNTVQKGEGFTVSQVEEVINANMNNAHPQGENFIDANLNNAPP